MTLKRNPVDLGPPNEDLKNSPIILDISEEREIIDPEIPEERFCFFNGESYPHGTFIKSNSTILECDRGAWVEST